MFTYFFTWGTQKPTPQDTRQVSSLSNVQLRHAIHHLLHHLHHFLLLLLPSSSGFGGIYIYIYLHIFLIFTYIDSFESFDWAEAASLRVSKQTFWITQISFPPCLRKPKGKPAAVLESSQPSLGDPLLQRLTFNH